MLLRLLRLLGLLDPATSLSLCPTHSTRNLNYGVTGYIFYPAFVQVE